MRAADAAWPNERKPARQNSVARKRRDIITATKNRCTLIAVFGFATGESESYRALVERDVRPGAVTKRVRAQDEVNPFGGIDEVERAGITETARADRAATTLKVAAAGHVEFVNDH